MHAKEAAVAVRYRPEGFILNDEHVFAGDAIKMSKRSPRPGASDLFHLLAGTQMEEAQGFEGLLHVLLLLRARLHGFGRNPGRCARRRTAVPSCSRKLFHRRRKHFPEDRFLLMQTGLHHAEAPAISARPRDRALVGLPGSYLIPRLAPILRLLLPPLPPTAWCSEQTITRLVWALRPEINQNKLQKGKAGRELERGHGRRAWEGSSLSASLARARAVKSEHVFVDVFCFFERGARGQRGAAVSEDELLKQTYEPVRPEGSPGQTCT